MKVSYEVKAGITQAALFLPATAAVIALVTVVQLACLVLDGYRSAAALHGASADLDALMFRPSIFARFAGGPVDPDELTELVTGLVSPASLYATTWVQNVSLVTACALIAGGAWLARRRLTGSAPSLRGAMVDTFALRRSSAAMLGIALFGGLSLSWLPSAVMEVVLRTVELDNLSTELITRALRDSGPLLLVVGVFTIGVGIPIFEELVFRGFLWHLGERWMHPALLLALTSFAFAVFHMSPAHVLGVALHAFFLGWLRLTSRSVVPPALAHVANNTLACALILASSDEGGTSAPVLVVMALGGAVATAGAAWGAWRLRER